MAAFSVMRLDGSRHTSCVSRSMASGHALKFVHRSMSFSFPLTCHLGNDVFISGSSMQFYHRLSLGVPSTLNILNSCPTSDSP